MGDAMQRDTGAGLNKNVQTCKKCGKGMSSPYISNGVCYHCRIDCW